MTMATTECNEASDIATEIMEFFTPECSEDDDISSDDSKSHDVNVAIIDSDNSNNSDVTLSSLNEMSSADRDNTRDNTNDNVYSIDRKTHFDLCEAYGGIESHDDFHVNVGLGENVAGIERVSMFSPNCEEDMSSSSSENELEEVFRHIEIIEVWTKNICLAEVYSTNGRGSSLRRLYGSITQPDVKFVLPQDIVAVDEDVMESLQFLSNYIINVKKNYRLVETVVQDVANIQNLMMYFILVKDDEDREKIMKYAIIKRVMLCQNSITRKSELGRTSWLSHLLQTRKSSIQKKVVDYLEKVSNITAEDMYKVDSSIRNSKAAKKVMKEDEERFGRYHDEIVETLRNETHLMPSLLLLKSKDLERASKTSLIKTALDLYLSHPFGVANVFFDIIAHAVLLFTKRYQVFFLMNQEEEQGYAPSEFTLEESYWRRVVGLTFPGLIALSYLLFRRITNELFLCSLSWNVWLVSFFQLTDLIDLVSMIFTITTYNLWIQHFKNGEALKEHTMNIFAINIGFLWVNLISHLKIINTKVATFANSIGGIVKEIIVFLVVIVGTVIWAFGDVLFIILKSNNEACPTSPKSDVDNAQNAFQGDQMSNILEDHFTSPFCMSMSESYLAVYRVFIGDLDVEEFEGTRLSIFVFVLLTFFAVIILLNVLIALVIKSHEASQLRSQELFGSARVQYVAKMIGFEIFLHPLTDRYASGNWRMVIKVITYCTGIMCLVSSILSGIFLVSCFKGRGMNDPSSKILAFCLITFADMILLALFSFVYTGWRETGGIYKYRKATRIRKLQNNAFMKNFVAVPATFVARLLMGMAQVKKKESEDSLVQKQNDKAKILMDRRMQKQVSFLRRQIDFNEYQRRKSSEKREKKEKTNVQKNKKDTGEIENLMTGLKMMEKNFNIMREEMSTTKEAMKEAMKMMEQNIIESVLKAKVAESSSNTTSRD